MKLKPVNIKNAYESVQKFMGRRGPGVLTGIGIALMGVAIWQAYERSEDIRTAAREKRQAGGNKIEVAVAGAKKAGPVIVAAAGGTACLVAAQKLNMDKIATLTATASAAMDARDILEKKLEETVGAEKATEIRKAMNQEVGKTIVESNGTKAVATGHGNVLFIEPYSGVSWRSSVNYVTRQLDDAAAKKFKAQDGLTLYELLYLQDIPAGKIPDVCSNIGWSIYSVPKIGYTLEGNPEIDEDTGEPSILLLFEDRPKENY